MPCKKKNSLSAKEFLKLVSKTEIFICSRWRRKLRKSRQSLATIYRRISSKKDCADLHHLFRATLYSMYFPKRYPYSYEWVLDRCDWLEDREFDNPLSDKNYCTKFKKIITFKLLTKLFSEYKQVLALD